MTHDPHQLATKMSPLLDGENADDIMAALGLLAVFVMTKLVPAEQRREYLKMWMATLEECVLKEER